MYPLNRSLTLVRHNLLQEGWDPALVLCLLGAELKLWIKRCSVQTLQRMRCLVHKQKPWTEASNGLWIPTKLSIEISQADSWIPPPEPWFGLEWIPGVCTSKEFPRAQRVGRTSPKSHLELFKESMQPALRRHPSKWRCCIWSLLLCVSYTDSWPAGGKEHLEALLSVPGAPPLATSVRLSSAGGDEWVWSFISVHFKREIWGFPGGAVVKNPPANAGDMGSSPGLGRSHVSRSN